jgi:hypothetical protein
LLALPGTCSFLIFHRLDLLIIENALAIPLNIPLGISLSELISETQISTIAHHHDFSWERPRRKEILTTVIPNILDFDNPPCWNSDDYGKFLSLFRLCPNDKTILQPTRIIKRKGMANPHEHVGSIYLPVYIFSWMCNAVKLNSPASVIAAIAAAYSLALRMPAILSASLAMGEIMPF